MQNSYLHTLGLQPGATKTDIKAAYRRLAKKYHPDINKNPEAKNRFIAIHEAYKFLLAVGPRPERETVNYDYNPYKAAYEERRRKAKAYAWKKANAAARQQRQQISLLLKYFRPVAALIVLLNLVLAIDYLLPKTTYEDRVVQISKTYSRGHSKYADPGYRYDDIYFGRFYLRADKGEAVGLKVGDKARIITTSLLEMPLRASIGEGEKRVEITQIYGIYRVYGYLIPIILAVFVLYRFFVHNLDHRLTLALLMVILFLIQLLLFLRF